MMLPALVTASQDEALRGSPLNVYVWLICHRLDNESYRTVKIEGLAATLKMKPDTVSRAMRLLHERGYLARRYVQREGYAWRLHLTRAALTSTSPPKRGYSSAR